jgi:hypothetical protein
MLNFLAIWFVKSHVVSQIGRYIKSCLIVKKGIELRFASWWAPSCPAPGLFTWSPGQLVSSPGRLVYWSPGLFTWSSGLLVSWSLLLVAWSTGRLVSSTGRLVWARTVRPIFWYVNWWYESPWFLGPSGVGLPCGLNPKWQITAGWVLSLQEDVRFRPFIGWSSGSQWICLTAYIWSWYGVSQVCSWSDLLVYRYTSGLLVLSSGRLYGLSAGCLSPTLHGVPEQFIFS